MMTFANPLHAQYLGNSAGIGLWKAFETLNRKGLMKTEMKGVFWHNLDEALWHIRKANFLSLWILVAEVEDLTWVGVGHVWQARLMRCLILTIEMLTND